MAAYKKEGFRKLRSFSQQMGEEPGKHIISFKEVTDYY